MARALADYETSGADEVLRSNSEAFFYKLEDMEFKVRSATIALLQDNQKYILCLETPETSLMSALLAKTLRNLKIDGFSNQHQDQIFTDFHNFIKINEKYGNWTNFPDLSISKVDIEEQLEQHSDVLTSWAKLVKEKSKKIIFIMKNSKYLEQSMMKTRMVYVLKLKFTELWEENERNDYRYENKVENNCENMNKQTMNDVINNAVSKAVNDSMKNVKLKDETSATSVLPKEAQNIELTSYLKLHGVESIYAKDHEGNTPLHLAAKNGRNKIVKGLLVCDAEIEVKNNNNCTPLHLAAQNGHHEVVGTLLENNANVNAINNFGQTPLHMAGYTNNVHSVELLLKFGAKIGDNIEEKDQSGNTPLHLAAQNGCHEVVGTLLENNANVNANNNSKQTPLHMACSTNNVHSVELLLKFGANIEAKDNYDNTPLHRASYSGNNTLITPLLQHGSNINAQNNGGRTPLHLAIESDEQEIVINLLEKGADINLKNKSGRTASDYARSCRRYNLIPIIEEHAALANKK